MRRTFGCPYLLGLLIVLLPSPARADFVTGPWDVATTDPAGGQGDGPITFANTSSPIVGDGTSNSAAGEMFDSPFPALTLSAAGDKIVFQGTVRLVGTPNSAASSGVPRTQFRFGLFDGDDDGPDDNGWVGYYMSNKHGNAGTPAGTLARKSVGNTTIYLSATAQTSLATVQGDGTSASLFHDDTYQMNLTIERNALGHLLISSTLLGANGFTQSLSATDMNAATQGTYTFDHVGFLLGANLAADQAFFSDLQVALNPVPEVSSFLLLGLIGILATAAKTRRSRRIAGSA